MAVVLGEPAPGTTPLVRLRGGRRDPAGSLIHSAPLACSPVAPPSGSRDGRGGEAARRNNEAAQVDGSLGVLVDEVGLHTGGGATDDMALLAVRHPSAVIGHDFLIISVTERVRAASLRITTDVPSEHL